MLPRYTTTTPGPTLSPSQLVFTGVVAITMYAVYVFVQTIRHRDYFLPAGVADDEAHAPPPTATATGLAFVLAADARRAYLPPLTSPTSPGCPSPRLAR